MVIDVCAFFRKERRDERTDRLTLQRVHRMLEADGVEDDACKGGSQGDGQGGS